MVTKARTRLITVIVSIGLTAGVSGCANSTKGSTVTPSDSTTASPSPTVSGVVSPARPSPSGDGARVTGRPGIFVGAWNGHGRRLTITADGSGAVLYRTYTWCSDNPKPPCDLMEGNVIHEGGHITFRLAQVVTAQKMSTASATVLTSTYPQVQPGSSQAFVLKGGIVTSTSFGMFCDEKASMAGACGA